MNDSPCDASPCYFQSGTGSHAQIRAISWPADASRASPWISMQSLRPPGSTHSRRWAMQCVPTEISRHWRLLAGGVAVLRSLAVSFQPSGGGPRACGRSVRRCACTALKRRRPRPRRRKRVPSRLGTIVSAQPAILAPSLSTSFTTGIVPAPTPPPPILCHFFHAAGSFRVPRPKCSPLLPRADIGHGGEDMLSCPRSVRR